MKTEKYRNQKKYFPKIKMDKITKTFFKNLKKKQLQTSDSA